MDATTLHGQFVTAWADLADDFPVEFNPTEHDHPETLVRRRAEDVDQNVEVIYHGDVVLLQENGHDGRDRRSFVWLAGQLDWTTVAQSTILEWLGTI